MIAGDYVAQNEPRITKGNMTERAMGSKMEIDIDSYKIGSQPEEVTLRV